MRVRSWIFLHERETRLSTKHRIFAYYILWVYCLILVLFYAVFTN